MKKTAYVFSAVGAIGAFCTCLLYLYMAGTCIFQHPERGGFELGIFLLFPSICEFGIFAIGILLIKKKKWMAAIAWSIISILVTAFLIVIVPSIGFAIANP